jgi:hypothetical protein
MPARFNNALIERLGGGDADDLSSGVGGGYAVLSIKASKWRVKLNKGETLIVNPQTGDTVPSLELVLLRANPQLSKTYYQGKWAEGDNSSPDCWSVDGITPDASVPTPVCKSCAACPMNAFGSRVSDNGSKGKACQDVRRIAVLPLGDLANEAFGGPMLLRVPPASLGDLATYGKTMKAQGFKYQLIGTRVGFDPDASYPKINFKPIRVLTEDEQATLAALLDDTSFSEKMHRILNESDVVADPAPAEVEQEEVTFEQPPPAVVAVPVTPKPVKPTAAKPAVTAPAKPTGATASFGAPAVAAKPAAAKPAAPKPAVAAPVAEEPDGDEPDDSSVEAIMASLGLPLDN